MSSEIDELRDEIRRLDRALVELTAKRLALARRVGELKQSVGQPIRNYVVEAEALRLVRDAADELGVRPQVAEELLKLEIRESLRVQEKDRVVRARPKGPAGSALVVGGAGNMGRWFVEFLDSKGYACTVVDPRGPLAGHPHVAALPDGRVQADLIFLATPPSVTPRLLADLAGRTDALVVDIASLKAPLLDALRAAVAQGARVASIHPMWGPATDMLASNNLVVCDVGHAEAALAARKLFEDTAANIVHMPVDEHDRFMALVLGLPHAANLVFGHALAALGTPYAEVAHLGGPTFQKQVMVAREVASENKDLYYEIQKLNPHTPHVLQRLRRSLEELEAALKQRPEFREYMTSAQQFFDGGEPAK